MAEATNTKEPPAITGVVNQQFFIEPLGGPQPPVSYLHNFPDTIYNKALDSNLVALMYALLGPAGIGALRQNYLRARLSIEENGLRTTDLDALYANPMSFARLALETYQDNTEGLLNNEQWSKIQESDASYKRRAMNYLKAIRAGGTLLGITLAAKSGLDRPVEVVENFRALYDAYSDDPLGLEYFGLTTSTEEVIILPRQDRPRSTVQILRMGEVESLEEAAIEGFFKLNVPLGGQETGLLPFDVSNEVLQEQLEALVVVGKGNVFVTGGPFPGNPLEIHFTGELADTPIPLIQVTFNSLINFELKSAAPPQLEFEQTGVSQDGEVASIPVEDWYYALQGIDNIKPVTAIVTPGKAPGITKRQLPNAVFSDSEFTEVLQYVTGIRQVKWPPLDSLHWIEGGIEHEAPLPLDAQQSHYVNFHNISKVLSYTEDAISEEDYTTTEYAGPPNDQVGQFSGAMVAVFEELAKFTDVHRRYSSEGAPATPPSIQTLQATAEDVNLIDGSYPIDYQSLPGVFQPPIETPFWASNERVEGVDYLEIDLGKVQAVNYITLEALNAPYDFSVAYDLQDKPPKRNFVPATYSAEVDGKTTQGIGHEIRPNPKAKVTFFVTNSLGGLIYTRFIRIGFTRRLGEEGNPFHGLPFCLTVQNLRVGRNIS